MKNTSSVILAGLLSMVIACNEDNILPTNPIGKVPKVFTVTISAVTDISANTAVSGGVINYDGDAVVTSRGVCWGTDPAPKTSGSKTSDGTGTGSFTSTINGLSAHTIYYVRAYATTNAGTSYSSELSFQTLGEGGPIIFNPTLIYGSVTDIDGNVYKTIEIGTQTWMAENLKTTKYRNGDPIPNLTDAGDWNASTSGAYCWYNNDITNKEIYGALYSRYALTDSRSVAPAGWHVPTSDEVVTLVNNLGGYFAAGGKIKETGTAHWLGPNKGATNESGFTALPGGSGGSSFIDLEKTGYFGLYATSPYLDDYWFTLFDDTIISFDSYGSGVSVRCVKD